MKIYSDYRKCEMRENHRAYENKFFYLPPNKKTKIPPKREKFFLKGITAVFLTKTKNSFNVKNLLKQCVILLNKFLAVKEYFNSPQLDTEC